MSGPAKPFEPDDPMALAAVAVDAEAGALEETARCLVEEYLLLGWDEPRLAALFRNPFYQLPHMIYRARGEAFVSGVIAETCARWGAWRTEAAGDAAAGDAAEDDVAEDDVVEHGAPEDDAPEDDAGASEAAEGNAAEDEEAGDDA